MSATFIRTLLVLVLCLALSPIYAQPATAPKTRINLGKDVASLSIGTGLDYAGAAGAKLNLQVVPHFSIFLSSGVWASRITTAIGGKLRLLRQPQSMVSPYLMGLYGNTDIAAYEYYTGRAIFEKGVAVGTGIDILNTTNSFGYLSIGANYAPKPSLIYFTFGLSAIIGRRLP
ncbi:MAG: hypothetical protein IT256_02380 [Chitinophagaceae bacterium]|nr:hypothetical protein [Chitinophagaceae bacterium]